MVDCIHTSLLGIVEAICDKDFFPNGGIDQPGCPTIADGALKNHFFEESIYTEVHYECFKRKRWIVQSPKGSNLLHSKHARRLSL